MKSHGHYYRECLQVFTHKYFSSNLTSTTNAYCWCVFMAHGRPTQMLPSLLE